MNIISNVRPKMGENMRKNFNLSKIFVISFHLITVFMNSTGNSIQDFCDNALNIHLRDEFKLY